MRPIALAVILTALTATARGAEKEGAGPSIKLDLGGGVSLEAVRMEPRECLV